MMTLKMTKFLKYVSDLHLESKSLHHPLLQPLFRPSSFHLALIGDIGNPFHHNLEEFLRRVADNHEKIFYVPGNHEYWNIDSQIYTISDTRHHLDRLCTKFSNVVLLDNSTFTIDGVKIIGSTLWSHVSKDIPYIENTIQNYQKIYKSPFKRLTVQDTNTFNKDAFTFIQKEIHDAPCVVLTHYPPLMCNSLANEYTSDPKFYGDKTYNVYHNDLKHLIRRPIKAWLYGHTHYNSSFYIDGVWVSANQMGYKGCKKFSAESKICLD